MKSRIYKKSDTSVENVEAFLSRIGDSNPFHMDSEMRVMPVMFPIHLLEQQTARPVESIEVRCSGRGAFFPAELDLDVENGDDQDAFYFSLDGNVIYEGKFTYTESKLIDNPDKFMALYRIGGALQREYQGKREEFTNEDIGTYKEQTLHFNDSARDLGEVIFGNETQERNRVFRVETSYVNGSPDLSAQGIARVQVMPEKTARRMIKMARKSLH